MKIGSRDHSPATLNYNRAMLRETNRQTQLRWPDIGAFKGGCVAAESVTLWRNINWTGNPPHVLYGRPLSGFEATKSDKGAYVTARVWMEEGQIVLSPEGS